MCFSFVTGRRDWAQGKASSSCRPPAPNCSPKPWPEKPRPSAWTWKTPLPNRARPRHAQPSRHSCKVTLRCARARPSSCASTRSTRRILRTTADLALAEPRVRGLKLGGGALFEPLGIERRGAAAVAQALFAVRLAAGEAGIAAYGTAFADIHDIDGFRAEAELSRRLGFQGKSCIHPSQVAVANAVYRPSDSEIAQARKVLDAARVADAQGTGAYLVDAKMVDKPFVARAQAIVDSARALDLPP